MQSETKKTAEKNSEVSIAVRQLLAFVQQEGGLAALSFGELSGAEGTRVHQAFFRKLREEQADFAYESEVGLSACFEADDLCLRVRGRADVIASDEAGQRKVIEVKSVALPMSEFSSQGEILHWNQARLYAYMDARAQAEKNCADKNFSAPAEIQYVLAYVSADDLGCLFLERTESFAALAAWFEDCCRLFLSFAANLRDYRRQRDRGLAALRFPHSSLRSGQREFMERFMKNLRTRSPLLVQAPTGTGKTLAALYPSLKALGAGWVEKIFYLTAKTSTRQVAEAALLNLCEKQPALRRITLMAKEKICLCPEFFCDTRLCPYAIRYYVNLHEGLAELLLNFAINADLLRAVGEKYKLCPFELSLDAALYCDVIIGDYNHAFDPRVRLIRFFSQPQAHFALLIDEAHNLPDRMREMYSAPLEEAQLVRAEAVVRARLGEQAGIFSALQRYFSALKESMRQNEAGFDRLEEDLHPATVMQAENFRALRQPAARFIRSLRALSFLLRPLLSELDEPAERRMLLDFYFAALFFLRVADEFYNERYVFCAQLERGELVFRLLCLDTSDRLIALYRHQHAALFFSATLTPLPYFSNAFCGSARDDRPDSLILPSPFPAENLSVCVYENIQTTFQERERSLGTLATLAALTVLARPGNYFLFFPSYQYLEKTRPLLERLLKGRNVALAVQRRGMDEVQQQDFLAQFAAGRTRSLLGLVLMGGIFGEGIDLLGERLHGVMLVGTGLPQLSPERELMKEYFNEQNGQGFAYAYQFPGFNKVLQAAGRLIRSENDKGLILLLDARYSRPDYRQLFPREWEPDFINSPEELKATLEAAPAYESDAGCDAQPE